MAGVSGATRTQVLPRPGWNGVAAGAAGVCFLVLGWATRPPGRPWALDQLAADGSAMMRAGSDLGWGWAYVYHFSDLALAAALVWMVLLVVRWRREGHLPAAPAAALALLGGGTMAAEGLKLALPRLLGPLGWPFAYSLGFPSGHATMSMTLGVALMLAARPRWRPLAGLGAGLVGSALTFCLYRGGFHSPADILGAAFLTLGVTLVLLPYRESARNAAPSREGSLLPVIGLALGLGWGLSGLLRLPYVDLEPGLPSARLAYEGAWRLCVGVAWAVPGGLGLWLGGHRRHWGLALVGALLWCGADQALIHRASPTEVPPRAGEVLRLTWFRTARREFTLVGRTAAWANQGRGLRWAYVAQLPLREARGQRALGALMASSSREDERASLEALDRAWNRMRVRAEAVAAAIRTGGATDPARLEDLRQARVEVDASLARVRLQMQAGPR